MPLDPAMNDRPQRRYNTLLDEWVLVSPHRAKRPWQGKMEDAAGVDQPDYLPDCYLCPGNTRAGGKVNDRYRSTYVFTNDFAALLTPAGDRRAYEACGGLIRAREECGICRVVCFSPKHNLTLPRMTAAEIRKVVDLWGEQYADLASYDFIGHVMIFENKGAVMGCSNPHPHGQIWASESLPSIAAKKVARQNGYFEDCGRHLLMDYLAWELAEEERILGANDSFVALVPFWAVWPYEMMVIPRRPVQSIPELTDRERDDWSALLREVLIRYDNVFDCSFPYSMGVNQLPVDGGRHAGVVLHQSFFPPLLRSATVKKFQVGYEMSGEPQRDITAEQAAQRLREASPVHYLDREA